jgi:tRNA A-37 threonylcarbamoyl transferase component Bud32
LLNPKLSKKLTPRAREQGWVFETEARIASHLSRLNVEFFPKIYRILCDTEWRCKRIIMECLNNNPLKPLVDSDNAVLIAAKISRKLLAAVSCMHEEGIRHKDIRPKNILLHTPDTLKLIDFGCAEAHDGTDWSPGFDLYCCADIIRFLLKNVSYSAKARNELRTITRRLEIDGEYSTAREAISDLDHFIRNF